MMRFALLPLFLGLGLVHSAQALDFQPTPTSTFGGRVIAGTRSLTVGNAGEVTLQPGGDVTTLVKSGSAILSAPVPEPKTYGMLLASLGLIGFMVRKRG